MEIKYARGVNPNSTDKVHGIKLGEQSKKQGSTYSGASWNGQIGPSSAPQTHTAREIRRYSGQRKGHTNPLLGACKSNPTIGQHLMHPVGLSVHSSKPQNRAAIRKMQRKWQSQNTEEVMDGNEIADVKNVEPE